MAYAAQRGTYDAFDGDSLNLEKIQELLKAIAKTYGYTPIHTPLYESTDLFVRSVGDSSDIVTKEMFSFLDKSGRDIALRPEVTASVMRAVVTNKLYATHDLPLKLSYCGPAFRYERPQAGRYRQFTQFGVECVGIQSPYSDAETIALGYHSLRMLGFPSVVLKINSLGDEISRSRYQAALRDYFASRVSTMCDDCKRRFTTNVLRILDCKVKEDQAICQGAPSIQAFLSEEAKTYFDTVCRLLDEEEIPYEIDDSLVRGLDYYSHVVFEYHYTSENGTSLGAIGAGGHYDHLVKEIGGPDLPAVGFALGIERLNTLLKEIHPCCYAQVKLDVFICPLTEEDRDYGFAICQDLRKNGFQVDMLFEKKSLPAQLKIAARKQAAFALILGENERKSAVYGVKNLKTQQQEMVAHDELISYFDEHLEEEEHHHE